MTEEFYDAVEEKKKNNQPLEIVLREGEKGLEQADEFS